MANIRQSAPPNLTGQPDIRLFRKDDFESVIFSKGYDVIIEQAIECPCKGKSGAAKTTCQNCLGIGWVFINAVQTKALITSINKQTKYQPWSPELTGTVNITVRDEERLSFMDRVTFKTRKTVQSEVRKVLSNGAQDFIFCSYKVESIKHIFLFDTDTQILKVLPTVNYSISPSNTIVVLLNNVSYPAQFNGVVSIEYEHQISYNVIDLPHDFRSTFLVNEKGQNVEYNMPIQGVARKSHLQLNNPTNYGGTNLLNNDTV